MRKRVKNAKKARGTEKMIDQKTASAIRDHLSKLDVGLKAAELASRFGVTKQQVNRYLYDHDKEFVRDNKFRWTLSRDLELNDPVLSKLNNRDNAVSYTLEDHSRLADWNNCTTHSGKKPKCTFRTPDGRVIDCDSKCEKKMLGHLLDSNCIIAWGGQSLCIPYGRNNSKKYFPDAVVLTKDMHIAIIEVKPFSFMNCRSCVSKYRALEDYCRERGFEFMMVDPYSDYLTFEELLEQGAGVPA